MIFWIMLVALINITNVASVDPQVDKAISKRNEQICKDIGKNAIFSPKLVVAKTWRVYYYWHMRVPQHTCVDITFKKVTKWTVDRYRRDMSEYLQTQPDWGAAAMFVRMGSMAQMLLFPAGPPGRVLGAPNVRRIRSMAKTRRGVPLMPFQFKLLRGGKYLVTVDCITGLVALAARVGKRPFPPEMTAVADGLGLGEGLPACVKVE